MAKTDIIFHDKVPILGTLLMIGRFKSPLSHTADSILTWGKADNASHSWLYGGNTIKHTTILTKQSFWNSNQLMALHSLNI